VLDTLSIRNVALIEELEISFVSGLNIFSGETGAGKSIIIDAVNFVLGGKAGKELIRTGTGEARVEAVFFGVNCGAFENIGIEADDGAVMLFRSINDAGKSVCRINGRTVTAGILREAGALLVDVHGQHGHQTLLNPARHIFIVDRFAGKLAANRLAELADVHKKYREISEALKKVRESEADRLAQLDLLNFQIEELECAEIESGEDEELNRRKRRLANAEKITKKANRGLELLSAGEFGAVDALHAAIGFVREVAAADESAAAAAERLEDIHAQLDDAARDFARYVDKLDFDPREIDEIETRLDLFYGLKRKYGQSADEMLKFLEAARGKRERLANAKETAERLEKDAGVIKKRVDALCEEVSAARKKAADFIGNEVEKALKELGMKDAAFLVSVGKAAVSSNGWDEVEFLISANNGEPPKPLSKIASGGEMSRVMLAIKAAIADADEVHTFIFDEIDAVVSGRAANKVAEKLRLVAKTRQVLCITHLPQIAAAGERNFLIEKTTVGGRTRTGVTTLDESGVVAEISRLIGGARVTEAAAAAAAELRNLASQPLA
jgi:DNA repair protein RecN (Recombination protein N)